MIIVDASSPIEDEVNAVELSAVKNIDTADCHFHYIPMCTNPSGNDTASPPELSASPFILTIPPFKARDKKRKKASAVVERKTLRKHKQRSSQVAIFFGLSFEHESDMVNFHVFVLQHQ